MEEVLGDEVLVVRFDAVGVVVVLVVVVDLVGAVVGLLDADDVLRRSVFDSEEIS